MYIVMLVKKKPKTQNQKTQTPILKDNPWLEIWALHRQKIILIQEKVTLEK